MSDSQLPFSQAAQNNQVPIMTVLKDYIKGEQAQLLEIGHGNAQHAVAMSSELKINWHPSDLKENNWILKQRRALIDNPFLHPEVELEIGRAPMDTQVNQKFDYIYTANTLHIMSLEHVMTFCREVSTVMKPDAYLFIYGPFKFDGEYTSDSNAHFNEWLKERNPLSGVRDFELVSKQLNTAGIKLIKRHDLPANNQLLVFKKESQEL